MNEINRVKVDGVIYDITAPSTYTPGNGINITNGEISIDASAITLPEWANQSNKPEYNYKEIVYTKGNTPSANSGIITLDGSNAVYKVVSDSNIAGISFSTLP